MMVVACGTVVARHDAYVTLNDPTRRLGPPPWSVSMDSPAGMKEGGSIDRGVVHGFSAPGKPFHAIFSNVDGSVGFIPRPSKEVIGFAIPALARNGWWRAEVRIAWNGACRGEARFCGWGSSEPTPDVRPLALHGKAKPNPNGNGWQFELTIDIPAAPSLEEQEAAEDRHISQMPLQGACSFVMYGQVTMEFSSRAHVAVVATARGDERRAAAVRKRLEAILRMRGCVVLDHARVDRALRDGLARDVRSTAAMDRLQDSGATLVLIADPNGDKSIRIVDLETREEIGNWWLQQ